jgi:prepilin-type N-terminal cleavage/methylation domain-containing protein
MSAININMFNFFKRQKDEKVRILPADRQGFTLIELVVAMGVFSLISVALVGLFVSSLRGEKKALNVQLVQDNARIVMETMVRELRDGSDVVFNSNQNVSFKDKSGMSITYYVDACSSSNVTNNCIKRMASGSAINLGSENVNVTNLQFYGVSSSASLNQPRVTILFTMESGVAPYKASINLQTTVSLRNMKL